ncbi:Gfo/Idh/MocA family oxidoreductase [Uliginosibacterium sp. H3]|uniref:Gfo/Idh/MocA family oxidoreductase n=1 Tax=Uliginosibacterium silvisoli TaxID=3114758 RepID=A0ABU6K8E7_9RHOO|nr:Gfo/Idh/MocA family oxidoreductase [Uliginosibacterium sp. H3]
MLRVCIIGGSGHYRYVLEGLDKRARLVGFAPGSDGEDIGKLKAALADNKLDATQYEDWQTMLDICQPDIVAINCHFGDHGLLNIDSLKRGLHVFSEKPVATTLGELATLRAAHAASGKCFSAMFGIRYKPWFLTAHEAVKAGRIGEIRLMQAQKSYKLGTRPAFFATRGTYGGTIPWVGSHAVDWVRWLSGEEFKSVFATQSTRHNQHNGQLEVSAQCQFTLGKEICASVSIDYLRPATANSHDDDRIRIVGTEGVLEVREKNVLLIDAKTPGVQTLAQSPEKSIFSEFIDEVLGTGKCMVSADDAFAVTQASLLARQSADESKLLSFV